MKLLFKQRFFSWFDSYDIYDENGNVYFQVKGKLSFGHLFYIYNKNGEKVGELEQKVFRFLPHFNMYENESLVGEIVKEFTFFKPSFSMNCNGWKVEGDWTEWDYEIFDSFGREIATITKELFNWTDTYIIDVKDEKNALRALMIVLAIDAVKCSNSSSNN